MIILFILKCVRKFDFLVSDTLSLSVKPVWMVGLNISMSAADYNAYTRLVLPASLLDEGPSGFGGATGGGEGGGILKHVISSSARLNPS